MYKVDWSRPEMTQGLVSRGEQSYKTREGDSYKGILDERMTRDLKIAKISMGDHYWSLIPYLTGEQDPEVISGRMQKGAPTYTVGVYTHRNIGPNQSKVICLAKTFGQPCPICEYREELNRQAPSQDEAENKRREEEIRALFSSKFMTYIYYVWDRDREQDGVQIYEISGFFFERELQQQAKSTRGGGYVPFMSPLAGPNGGRDIAFKVSGSNQKQDWTGVKFEMRDRPIPPNILAQAKVPLDELLSIPDYNELKEMFWAGVSQAGEEGQGAGEEADGSEVPTPECWASGYAGSYVDCQSCELFVQCQEYNPPTSEEAPAEEQEEPPTEEELPVDETPVEEEPPTEEEPPAPAPGPTRRTPTSAPAPGQRPVGPPGPGPRRPTPLRRGQK